MQCPACRSQHQSTLNLRSQEYALQITECRTCGTTWSTTKDGLAEVMKSTPLASFLPGRPEWVESAKDFIFQ